MHVKLASLLYESEEHVTQTGVHITMTPEFGWWPVEYESSIPIYRQLMNNIQRGNMEIYQKPNMRERITNLYRLLYQTVMEFKGSLDRDLTASKKYAAMDAIDKAFAKDRDMQHQFKEAVRTITLISEKGLLFMTVADVMEDIHDALTQDASIEKYTRYELLRPLERAIKHKLSTAQFNYRGETLADLVVHEWVMFGRPTDNVVATLTAQQPSTDLTYMVTNRATGDQEVQRLKDKLVELYVTGKERLDREARKQRRQR